MFLARTRQGAGFERIPFSEFLHLFVITATGDCLAEDLLYEICSAEIVIACGYIWFRGRQKSTAGLSGAQNFFPGGGLFVKALRHA